MKLPWSKVTSVLSRRELALGAYLLDLYREHGWTVRRVQNVSMVDLSRFERRVSLDLDVRALRRIARWAGRVPTEGFFVPIGTFKKELLLDFDVHSQGRTLQLLPAAENGDLSRLMILAYLHEHKCPQSLMSRISETISSIVHQQPDIDPEPAWDQIRRATSSAELAHLERIDGFQSLLETFRTQYLAVVRLKDPHTPSTSLKYRIVQDAGEWNPGVLERLGIKLPVMKISHQLGGSQSDHVNVEAPQGLLVEEAVTRVQDLNGTWHPINNIEDLEWAQRAPSKQYALYLKAEKRKLIESYLEMTPGLGEFHLPALMSMTFTLVLLLAGFAAEWFGAQISRLGEPSAMVTILALVPSLLNVYLTRPGEHPVVSRLVATPRTLVFIASASTVVVAGAISLKYCSEVIWWSFVVASGYAGLVWLLLLVIVIRVSRKQRQHANTR